MDYSVHVRRPAVVVTMPPADLFKDVTFAAGTVGSQTVLQDIASYVNAPLQVISDSASSIFAVCGYSTYNKRDICNGSFPFDKSGQYYKTNAGYQVYLPLNIYEEVDQIVKFSFVSTADPKKRVDYSVHVRRPAAPS